VFFFVSLLLQVFLILSQVQTSLIDIESRLDRLTGAVRSLEEVLKNNISEPGNRRIVPAHRVAKKRRRVPVHKSSTENKLAVSFYWLG
jgi:short subunit dehydrogenase-like uncharacterized protein